MAHAGIKQEKLLASPIHWRFLDPLGEKFVKKYKLNPAFGKLPKLQILYGVCIALFNYGHKKFGITYANPEEQVFLANLIDKR